MIQVILLRGSDDDIRKVTDVLLAAERSGEVHLMRLSQDAWLIQTIAKTIVWRDHIKERTPQTLEIFVAELHGGWASSGFGVETDWMKDRSES